MTFKTEFQSHMRLAAGWLAAFKFSKNMIINLKEISFRVGFAYMRNAPLNNRQLTS